jgi:hypothetical protein
MDDDVQKITYKPIEPQEIMGQIKAEYSESAWFQAQLNPAEYNIAPEDPEMLALPVKGSWGSKVSLWVILPEILISNGTVCSAA